jgi:hypothetical protein
MERRTVVTASLVGICRLVVVMRRFFSILARGPGTRMAFGRGGVIEQWGHRASMGWIGISGRLGNRLRVGVYLYYLNI